MANQENSSATTVPQLPLAKIIREPRTIPNQEGFRCAGITKDKQFIWLCVQKINDSYTLGNGVFATLESWMTVEDFKKFVLPAVEAAKQ